MSDFTLWRNLGLAVFVLLVISGAVVFKHGPPKPPPPPITDTSSPISTGWIPAGSSTLLKVIEVEGHRYLLGGIYASTFGGFAIVHAESCPCKSNSVPIRLEKTDLQKMDLQK